MWPTRAELFAHELCTTVSKKQGPLAHFVFLCALAELLCCLQCGALTQTANSRLEVPVCILYIYASSSIASP